LKLLVPTPALQQVLLKLFRQQYNENAFASHGRLLLLLIPNLIDNVAVKQINQQKSKNGHLKHDRPV